MQFHAKHWILNDIKEYLKNECNENNLNHASADVYVGVHEWVFDPIKNDRLNIGIQTEHFTDYCARKLPSNRSFFYKLSILLKYDLILDINENNGSSYGILRTLFKKKLILGPYILPVKKIKYISSGNRFALLSNTPEINERMPKGIVSNTDIIKGLSWHEAIFWYENCKAIINLHRFDGIYTEWPRFIMAMLAGKVLYSEPLSPPLVAGVHYVPLNEDLNNYNLDSIYENNMKIMERYSLMKFVNISLHESLNTKSSTRRLRIKTYNFLIRIFRALILERPR